MPQRHFYTAGLAVYITLDNTMTNEAGNDTTTTLVFCGPAVNPNLVTKALGVEPTESKEAGGPAEIGTWKLALDIAAESNTVEDQIDEWLGFLEPKGEYIAHLVGLGYSPYLDCRAEPRSLSLCIEPEQLIRLGKLGISLSVWLFEYPVQQVV